MSLKYSVPDWMKDTQTVLNIVKSLDEGREFITDDSFASFKPSIHHFKIDYMCIRGRNMQKPLFKLWKVNWQQTFIIGRVNPSGNKSLFTTTLKNKIFNRFELPLEFNRLLSKWYYDTVIDIKKLECTI